MGHGGPGRPWKVSRKAEHEPVYQQKKIFQKNKKISVTGFNNLGCGNAYTSREDKRLLAYKSDNLARRA
jgi:hypothetical protein